MTDCLWTSRARRTLKICRKYLYNIYFKMAFLNFWFFASFSIFRLVKMVGGLGSRVSAQIGYLMLIWGTVITEVFRKFCETQTWYGPLVFFITSENLCFIILIHQKASETHRNFSISKKLIFQKIIRSISQKVSVRDFAWFQLPWVIL